MVEKESSYEERQKPSPDGKRWYKVRVASSHVRPGSKERHNLYVFTQDSISALDLAQNLSGWKRHLGRHRFPEIHELTEEEKSELIETIRKANVSMDRAMREGFYGRRKDGHF